MYVSIVGAEVVYYKYINIKPLYVLIEENNIKTMKEARNCKELWDVSNGITLSEECI